MLCLLVPALLHAQDSLTVKINGQNTPAIPTLLFLNNGTGNVVATPSMFGGGGGSSSPAVATAENKAAPSVTTTSATALAANASRKNATVTNAGTVVVTLGLGGAAVASQGVTLQPGQSYNIDSTNLYQGAITAIVASGTSTLSIHEGY